MLRPQVTLSGPDAESGEHGPRTRWSRLGFKCIVVRPTLRHCDCANRCGFPRHFTPPCPLDRHWEAQFWFSFFFFFLTSSICGESDIGTDSPPVPLALAAYASMRSRGAPHTARRPSGISRLPFKPLKTLLNSEANEFTQILTQYILLLIHLRSDLILLPKGTKMLGKI